MNKPKDDVNGLLTQAIADHQNGLLEKAEKGYANILALSPDHADALHLLGLIAFQQGSNQQARDLIARAITQNSRVFLYMANLGRVEMALENYDNAVAAWQKALALDPYSADVLSDLSGALLKLNAPDDALLRAEKALSLQEGHALALLNKGLAHVALNQTGAAIEALSVSSNTFPEDIEIWFQLGRLYQMGGKLETAEAAYRRVLTLSTFHFEALNNLGNLCRDLGRFEEALAFYERAIQSEPEKSETHSNLGVVCQEMGDSAKAIACYRQAVNLDSKNAEAWRNLGMGLLQIGAFLEGWHAYEWRWKTAHFKPLVRTWAQPQWRGEEALDKALLVHCEQGFGDSIQFARYLPLAARKFGRVILEAPQELKSLLGRLDGVSDVVVQGNPLPEHDYHMPLLSLPFVFQTSLENIPSQIPYLQVDTNKAARWQNRLAKKAGQKLVGLVWQGSHHHQRDAMRSPGLTVLSSLLNSCASIRFISLQKDAPERVPSAIEDYTPHLKSFDDTAALIRNLDAVVSADTGVAHLAGALGIKTYVMLPHVAEWRWLINRDDSPWYPTMTLVRQQTRGDWASCIAFISQELST